MGLRFRKSINLGGGFRINLSKSGIGYSWGTKGFRITKTARGTIRSTAYIPGTGISYVSERKTKITPRIDKSNSDNSYIETGIPRYAEKVLIQHKQEVDAYNEDLSGYEGISNLSNYEPIPKSYSGEQIEQIKGINGTELTIENIADLGRKRLKLRNIFLKATIFFSILCIESLFVDKTLRAFYTMLALTIISGLIALIVTEFFRFKLKYNPDKTNLNHIKPLMDAINSKLVWRITDVELVSDTEIKYNAGAQSNFNRRIISLSRRVQFPFKSNIKIASFYYDKTTLIFLPEGVLVIKGSNIKALSYSDIKINSSYIQFIDTEKLQKDTEIIGYTWMYVNKSGEPDRRFRDNPQLPICLYGIITIQSDIGIALALMYSGTKAR